MPASLYELVQEMGRVDRLLLAVPGTNTYAIQLDFSSCISIYVHIVQCPNTNERKVQLSQLHKVLQALVTPNVCFHTFIEEYFEWEAQTTKTSCGLYCSKCLSKVPNLAKRVSKNGVISFLAMKVFAAGENPTCSIFKKGMKADMNIIFHPEDVPKDKNMGQIHALAL